LCINDRVDFLGSQPQTELPYFYSAADLTIMPSHYESFGMVALESMACGTPVVASRVGGLARLVKDGETGILVPEEEPTALAMQIHATLQNDCERQAMGVQAAAYARDFAWGRIADRMCDLYDEQIHSRANRESPCVV
jgi:D-inositol-3-phosphate glycosyltransferase